MIWQFCKLSPLETQILFSGKNKKNKITNLSSAKRVVNVKYAIGDQSILQLRRTKEEEEEEEEKHSKILSYTVIVCMLDPVPINFH